MVPGPGAAGRAGTVAIRPVATKWLPGALMAGPEAIGPAARLANRELRDGTRGRGLPLSRQRRPDQRAVYGTLLVGARFVRILVSLDLFHHPIVFRGEVHLHFGVVGVFVRVERGVLDCLRPAADVDVIVMLVDRWRRGLMRRNALGCVGGDLRIQGGRRIQLAALARNLGVFVFVLGVSRRAARLFDVGTNHRHHGVVGQPPLSRAVIVQNVTKPRLALLHPKSPRIRRRGIARKADAILAELVSRWQ